MAEKATIFMFSGDMDKVHKALLIVNSFAACGMEVTVLFACWGLNVVKKDRGPIRGAKSLLQKMMSRMNRGGISRLPLSRFHWMGIGKRMMQWMMKSHGVPAMAELISKAKQSGARMWACRMTMDVTGVAQEDLIPEIDRIVCLDEYSREVMGSKVNLFIS